MREFLQGKWLGHPLHPFLAHLPTALWPAALVFDILSNLGVGGNAMVQTAFYAILLGLLAALAAAPAGFADWLDIKPDKPARRIGLYHMGINLTVVVLQVVNAILRWGEVGTAASVGALPLALSAVSTAALLVSGYLGGLMIYDYGINVARLSKGKWREIAREGGARLPEAEK
jgi:uncharacterized membrane protein